MTIGAVRTGRNERRELWTVVKKKGGFFFFFLARLCALRNAVWMFYGCCHFLFPRSSRALVTRQKPQTISPFIYKFHFNHFFLFLLFHQKANKFGEIICYFLASSTNLQSTQDVCCYALRYGGPKRGLQTSSGSTGRLCLQVLPASFHQGTQPSSPPFCHWNHQWNVTRDDFYLVI